MRLPASIRDPLDALLEQRGHGRIRSIEPVGGGCISETGHLRTSDELDFFLKWIATDSQPPGLFRAEADSLAAIANTNAARVPRVIDVHDDVPGETSSAGARWLLLEWLEPGLANTGTWVALGQALALLHRNLGPAPGWGSDNYIGTLPQSNTPSSDWPSFWRDRRLLPQLKRATDAGLLGSGDAARFDALCARLDDLLAPASADGWSLLHGDLWSGNLHVMESGDPALVDPSCSWGHREVDLAMSHLFGGFDAAFYAAYSEAWPLESGYERGRRASYQLYYLLVHVNLFGLNYRARTLDTLRSIGF